ncbi:uncharacterized protein LOC122721104 isoform X3 [Apis laboriosa]|uniref:uncharacterized protein LOC102680729 n=1 Tax=Apis dorsata TaxID=7462 RepID=UPI0003DF55B8|nr:uncharacterized protein LOC102680729 [Apis dorsata]XP_043804318.1 uncharacterized protein LOC122721104 isoform X3 [Apis laboriosa]
MMSGATRLDQDWMRMVELRGGTGMTSGLSGRSSSRLHYTILTILDTVFSATVAAPAVVGYWRGTWGLSDVYVYPEDPVFSSLTSIVIGFIGLYAFNVSQNVLNELLHPDKHRLSYYVGSRLYTAVFGFCCVNAWRGAWQALDLYTEHTASTVFATTIVSLLALAIMRAVRNISAPPFSLCLDSCPGYFEVQTMFRVNNTRDWSLYLLDCAFSVGVVGTLVVFVWRGVWILFDLYLFPDNHEYSAIGSLAIGYVIVTMTFSLQPLMRYACARLQGLARLIVADCFLLLSFLGTVNVWRGIWNVLDLWLVPDNPEMSCWITHVGCFVFLVLLNCSNSILVRGVYIDAEEDDGKCVVFPCHYLRLFFKIEREKKEARRQNLLVASKDFRPRPDGNPKDTENGALLPNSTATTILPTNPESLV